MAGRPKRMLAKLEDLLMRATTVLRDFTELKRLRERHVKSTGQWNETFDTALDLVVRLDLLVEWARGRVRDGTAANTEQAADCAGPPDDAVPPAP